MGSYLNGADLSGADLSGAKMSNDKMVGAELRGADLSSNLSNAAGTNLRSCPLKLPNGWVCAPEGDNVYYLYKKEG